jgi:hypothetical protein
MQLPDCDMLHKSTESHLGGIGWCACINSFRRHHPLAICQALVFNFGVHRELDLIRVASDMVPCLILFNARWSR